jgi:hypothetical protein
MPTAPKQVVANVILDARDMLSNVLVKSRRRLCVP